MFVTDNYYFCVFLFVYFNMGTSFKIMLHPLKVLKDKKKPVVLRLTNNRKRYYNYLGYHVPFPYEDYWDESTGEFKKKYDKDNYHKLNNYLRNKLALASTIIIDIQTKGLDFDYELFKKRFERENKSITIIEYFDERIKSLRNKNQIGNSIVYNTAKNNLIRFKGSESISFSEITPKFLEKMEEDFIKRGSKRNGISVHMRTIRAVFNQAVKEDICPRDLYPFKSQLTPNGYDISKLQTQTAKRAITKDDIKKIVDYDPRENERLLFAKNIFLFSYYNMGMNFTDIALLKWCDIYNGRVNYLRAKSRHKKKYTPKILDPAQEILDYYGKFQYDNNYIFPIIHKEHKTPIQIKHRIQTSLKQVNKDLRTIAKDLKLNCTLTTYVARHSWATILKRLGVSTAIISEGLGHSDPKTTQIYLDSFENDVLDDANSKLL